MKRRQQKTNWYGNSSSFDSYLKDLYTQQYQLDSVDQKKQLLKELSNSKQIYKDSPLYKLCKTNYRGKDWYKHNQYWTGHSNHLHWSADTYYGQSSGHLRGKHKGKGPYGEYISIDVYRAVTHDHIQCTISVNKRSFTFVIAGELLAHYGQGTLTMDNLSRLLFEQVYSGLKKMHLDHGPNYGTHAPNTRDYLRQEMLNENAISFNDKAIKGAGLTIQPSIVAFDETISDDEGWLNKRVKEICLPL